MIRDIMDKQRAATALYSKNEVQNAELFNKQENPFTVSSVTIALDTARDPSAPYTIKIPHRSFYVQDATDVNVSVDVQLQSRDSINSTFKIRKNDSISYGAIMPEVSLSWSAQSGKTITIVFFFDAQFMSGSQISVTGGGVLVSEGSSYSDQILTLSVGNQTLVFASDSTRFVGVIQNTTAYSIWVGTSTVTNSGATRGYEIPPGASFEWKNTAALYAFHPTVAVPIFVRTMR